MSGDKTAVVLGGYGLIGAACRRALRADGFRVVGVCRSRERAARAGLDGEWIERDIAATPPETWARDLAGADVVVNASGALQDGLRDRLTAIHEAAIADLVKGLAGSGARFIQISAAGVSEDSSTEFFRSKARGDALLMASDLDWVVLRPALVLAPQAHGGTALLRASAAMPLLGVKAFPEAPVQTVYIDDVAAAVVQAARGEVASRTLADLSEAAPHRFDDLTSAMRAWLGFPPWRASVTAPAPLIRALGRAADLFGWLGWRSPLRTSALRALEDGVTSDPGPWLAAGGRPCRGLGETLAAMPATRQERWFARLYLMLPLVIGSLALFWIASGAIGLIERRAAEAVLIARGFETAPARLFVLGGALADLALGLAILVQPLARRACFGMAALSCAYLIGATLWAPDLWADPLGPMVKVLPGLVLALVAAAMLEER